jgi:hypothetical protein
MQEKTCSKTTKIDGSGPVSGPEFLASSRIYVQNLIQYGNPFCPWVAFILLPVAPLYLGGCARWSRVQPAVPFHAALFGSLNEKF